MTGAVWALVGCQADRCAAEASSYYLDEVRMWDGQPICQHCNEDCDYAERDEGGRICISWSDLRPVKLKDLRA